MTDFCKSLLVAVSLSVLSACSDGGGGGTDDNETPEGETDEEGMDGGGRRDSGLDASKPPVKLPDGAIIGGNDSDAGSDGGTTTVTDAGVDIDAAVPDAGKADAGKLDAAVPGKADAGKVDAAVPDASKPDASKPDDTEPDAAADAGNQSDADAGNVPDAGPVDPYADCTDDEPLGCFTAQADNAASCPDKPPVGNAECTVDVATGAPAVCAYDAPNGDADDVATCVCLPLLGWSYL